MSNYGVAYGGGGTQLLDMQKISIYRSDSGPAKAYSTKFELRSTALHPNYFGLSAAIYKDGEPPWGPTSACLPQ